MEPLDSGKTAMRRLMSSTPGAGMTGGVWMQTNGCGRAPSFADQAIAITPGKAVKSETESEGSHEPTAADADDGGGEGRGQS